MARYGWIVTKDNVTGELHGVVDGFARLPSRVGWIGPRDASDEVVAALKAGAGVKWRTGPDGCREGDPRATKDAGGWSYYGRCVDLDATEGGADAMSEDALSAPLDNLGTPDAGDAIIEHKDDMDTAWRLIIG